VLWQLGSIADGISAEMIWCTLNDLRNRLTAYSEIENSLDFDWINLEFDKLIAVYCHIYLNR